MRLNLWSPSSCPAHEISRGLLPFYLRPFVLVVFMVVSLAGEIAWTTAVGMVGGIALRWCSFGFVFGMVLGYMHGRWTAKMWARDYLRVLKREITFWRAKGGKGTTIFVTFGLAAPVFLAVFLKLSFEMLAGLQSYIFGFIGGMNLALCLWVRRLPK